MLTDNVNLINDENSIIDVLLYSYLKKAAFKKQQGITDFLLTRNLKKMWEGLT